MLLRAEGADYRRRRALGLFQGAITSLGSRAVSVMVTFLSVPLTIGLLGNERYGVWITLNSLLAWLQITDFGLGHGLTNVVTSAISSNRIELARAHISNGLLLLSTIAIAAGLFFVSVYPFIPWSDLFGVKGAGASSEIGPAVALTVFIFLLQFPTSIAQKIFIANQEGRIGNYWNICGSILSLSALLIVVNARGGLIWIIIAVCGVSLVVGASSLIWLFTWHRPSLAPRLSAIDRSLMPQLAGVGSKFFLLQFLTLVAFFTDNFVISYYLGSSHVPEYSLTYNLFNYASLPQNVLFAYLWSAYNDALTRGDIDWVRKALKLNLIGSLVFALAMNFILIFTAQDFISWWSGGIVRPSFQLVILMATWTIINAFTSPMFCLLNAASHLTNQIVYVSLASAANFALSIYLVTRVGSAGVMLATAASYLVFICVPIYYDVRLLLGRLNASHSSVA